MISTNPGALPTDTTVRWRWALMLGHLLLWTAVPILTQANVPIDTAEMLYWGHEWQWGYPKHPPLPAWAAEASMVLCGGSVWSTYLLSQLCILSCFAAAWRLGRIALRPWEALAAVAVMEACVYYNYTTPEFNNNLMAKVGWAWYAYFLYQGITRGRWRDWALGGIFLGVAFLSKYDVALLLISVLVFSVVDRRARVCWRTPGPWIMTAVSLVLFAPHLRWLAANDFCTIHYLLHRSAQFQNTATPDWLRYLTNPLEFVGSQLAVVGASLLVSMFAFGWKWKIRTAEGEALYLRRFVTCVVLGPPAVALGFSLLTGSRLASMWGASMFTDLGVLLFLWFDAPGAEPPLKRVIVASVVVGIGCAIGLAATNMYACHFFQNRAPRVDFPGQQLALRVESLWSERDSGPLRQIGGDCWYAASVSVYHPLRPSVFADLDAASSPWLDVKNWDRDGGMILWNVDRVDAEYREKLAQKFPAAEILPPIEIAWKKTPARPPLRVGVAILSKHPRHATPHKE